MEKESLVYVDRKNSGCIKWDALEATFGEGSQDLLPLWIADADFKSPRAVLEALEKWLSHGVFGYAATPEEYYSSVIRWEKERLGYEIKREWIHYGYGTVSALYFLTSCFTQPGDGVVVLTPVYYPFFSTIENTGRRVVRSQVINDNGNYSIDFDDFEKKIVDNNVTMFIHCSPHNPLGRVWTMDEQKKLLSICQKHKVLFVSDEIHQDLIMPGHRNIPVGTLSDEVITVTAASKTFNLAGFSTSTIFIPNEKQRQTYEEYMKQYHVNAATLPAYIATQAAYTHGEGWLDSFIDLIWDNYNTMCTILKEGAPNVVVAPLQGTYLAWLDFRAYDCVKTAKEFCQQTCGLAADYGDWFGGDDYVRFARINLATKKEIIVEAAQAIVKGLSK